MENAAWVCGTDINNRAATKRKLLTAVDCLSFIGI
jgi:hypothetical protein